MDAGGFDGVGEGHGGQNNDEAAREDRRTRPRGAQEQDDVMVRTST